MSNKSSRMKPVDPIRGARLVSNNNETGKFIDNVYRFGEYFYYTHQYKSHQHYVQSKFKTIKQEATQNNIYPISIKQWNQTKESAVLFLNRMRTDCTANNIDQQQYCFHTFGIRLFARSHIYYNKRYRIKAGQQISVQHILAVKLFFNNACLCSAIRKTYWARSQNESLNDIKERHANFAHICRHILEAIYLFGNEMSKDMHVYRGVTQQTFQWYDATWSGPLSTSIDFKVAKRFTGPTGSVVELESRELNEMYIYGGGSTHQYHRSNIPQTMTDSVNTCSLSKFDEKECLMWSPCLNIVDIPYSRNRKQCDIAPYISAMRLFEKSSNGHLFSMNEKQKLLSDDVQNKLSALMEWKTSGNDEELIKCIQYDESMRLQSQRSENDTDNEAYDEQQINHRDYRPIGATIAKEQSRKPLNILSLRKRFIKSLCGTVFESVLGNTKTLWMNGDTKLNANLQENLKRLFTEKTNTSILTYECNILEWELSVDALRNAQILNNQYLAVNGYLRKQILMNDIALLNTLIGCDEIMNCIGYYFDAERSALAFKCDWKCNFQYGDDIYTINPVIVILPSSFRANNKFYNMVIQIEGDIDAIKGKENLMWSFDVLCDELDICLHFVDRSVLSFRSRKQQIPRMSNHEIQQFVNDEKTIVWKIAFRFHH